MTWAVLQKGWGLGWWPLLGVAVGLVIGAVAVAAPLGIGARALREMEF